jgi:hypothetical protein
MDTVQVRSVEVFKIGPVNACTAEQAIVQGVSLHDHRDMCANI